MHVLPNLLASYREAGSFFKIDHELERIRHELFIAFGDEATEYSVYTISVMASSASR
jgi:hypothetical protein